MIDLSIALLTQDLIKLLSSPVVDKNSLGVEEVFVTIDYFRLAQTEQEARKRSQSINMSFVPMDRIVIGLAVGIMNGFGGNLFMVELLVVINF